MHVMKLKPEETLFRDESVFDPAWLPEDFLFRDAQMRELAACAKPALRGSKPGHAFIFGRPATGKTTAVKITFGKLQEEASRALLVHVNCQIYNSQYRILGEIHKKLFGFVPPESGMPVASLYDRVFCRLEKEKKVLIIALDDMNFYDARQTNAVLYELLRSHEIYPKTRAAVWCVSANNELHRLEDKVRSSFVSSAIEFYPYRKEEMKQILKARALQGLFANVISDTLLEKIAGAASDLRHGIELLKKSALLAEKASSRKITEAHVNAALKSFEVPASSAMPDDEKILLGMLKRKSRESGELYEDYRKITGASYAKFYRVLQRMKNRKLVETESVGKGRGRTRRIRLAGK